ncbi:ABC transporter substrate-binding protein [Brachybacterium sp. YJGR34]|uniref:ABC transporter substrate-binding protein n=1 Tax=Brachybacterium sp. YJGR34 TaxID=2059911 RepID=UPI000E0B0D92|nr:extracellular solute-binding protein [Brachybacterium sp. YJGR34]
MGMSRSSGVSRRSALKYGATASAGAIAASTLASCGDASGGTTEIRMWSWYSEQQEVLPKVIDAFQEKNPSITVTNRIFGSPDQYLPALQAAVSGGDIPEIFAPHTRALEYGANGISLDLKAALGADFTDRFFESANNQYTQDGAQYGIGWMAQTFGIFYNPESFAAAGVDGEPETWDDLIAAADLIRGIDLAPLSASFNPGTSGLDFFLPLITQVTDDPTWYLALDRGESGYEYTSPEVVQALELFETIVKGSVFQNGAGATQGAEATQLFYTGRAAMLFSGSWTPQGLVQDADPEFVETYKVMKNPAIASGEQHWTANQAGAGWSVTSEESKQDAILEFLSFLYEDEQYSTLMNESNSMPATKAAAERIENPIMEQMTSWLIDGDGCPHIPFGPGSSEAGGPLMSILDGSGTPEQVAQDMQDAVANARGTAS